MKNHKTLSVVVALLLLVSSLAACTSAPAASPTTAPATENPTSAPAETETPAATDSGPVDYSTLPLVTYSCYNNIANAEKWGSNPQDLITPYIEKKFNVALTDVVSWNSSNSFTQMINLWQASGATPDVFISTVAQLDELHTNGMLQPLDDMMAKMPNLSKYFDEKWWPYYTRDGKRFFLPCSDANPDPADVYNAGSFNHAMWAREDILKQAGYSFTPVADIAAATTAVGKKPTAEDFAITPAIKTTADFTELLRKIKALNLTVNGKPVYPLDVSVYYQFHLGIMGGFGWFERQDDGTVGGYLGLKGAKNWYNTIRQWYQEDLIDPDFVIQKMEQLQAKCASGQVAVGFNVSDFPAAQKALVSINPEWTTRFIPWPKDNPNEGWFDIGTAAYDVLGIRKDFKDTDRLAAMWDWMLSDEGWDMLTWGPETSGLWKLGADGKKVFADDEVKNDMLNHVLGKKGADVYGLFDYTKDLSPFWSKIGNCFPFVRFVNPKDYGYSYPPNLDINTVNRNLVGQGGMNRDGTATYGAGENCDAAINYFWGDFATITCAKLFQAKTDDEFNAAWDEVYQDFVTNGKYEAAVADATKILDATGMK